MLSKSEYLHNYGYYRCFGWRERRKYLDKMAVNWGGIVSIIIFYIIILVIGLWASRKSKGDKDPDSVLVANRDLSLFVGTFTTAGKGFMNDAFKAVHSKNIKLLPEKKIW